MPTADRPHGEGVRGFIGEVRLMASASLLPYRDEAGRRQDDEAETMLEKAVSGRQK